MSDEILKRLAIGDFGHQVCAVGQMIKLEKLKTILSQNSLLNFINLGGETIDEMLDSRDRREFETDWLRIFKTLEQRSFSAADLSEIEKVREIAYKKTFASTENSELAAYVADDFELIAKSLLADFSDEWLNALFLAYFKETWTAESLIAERAKRGSREKFLDFMNQVPDVEPDERDRIS